MEEIRRLLSGLHSTIEWTLSSPAVRDQQERRIQELAWIKCIFSQWSSA
mgnify:FL=1